MLMRANDRKKMPFGRLGSERDSVLQQIATSRVEIDAGRLVVLNAAVMIDELETRDARTEIGAAKILIPRMTSKVIDRAVQLFGGEGLCQDTPLAQMWAYNRTLRLGDGPDEVHLHQLGKDENRRSTDITSRIQQQQAKARVLLKQDGVTLLSEYKL